MRWAPAGVAAAAGAGVAAAAATTPAGGEPTVYVPPRVTRPADRQPIAPARRQETYDEDDGGTPWWTWLLAVLGVVLLGTIGFLGVQLLGGLGGPSQSPEPSVAQVAVPDCEGASVTTVRSRLIDAGLTPADEEVEEVSDTIDEGDVIRCEPTSGTEVDEESEVTIFVSSGAEEVAVPSLRGQTQADATQTLREVGLRLGEITQEFDPDVPEGSVIRSDPASGVDVPRDSQVNLVISRGPSPSPTPSPTPVPTPTPTPVPTPPPTPTPTPTPTPAPTP